MASSLITLINVGINGTLTGMLYGLMALGLSIIFGVTHIINFAHGEMLILASLLAISLYSLFSVPLLMLLPLVGGLMFIFGYLLQKGLINRLLSHSSHSQFITMAGIALVLLNLEQLIFGTEAKSLVTSYSLASLQFGDFLIDYPRLFAAIGATITVIILFFLFKSTYYGKAIRACADNLFGAKIIGLNYPNLYAISFGIACLAIGISGTLLSLVIDITPQAGPQFTLLGFIIVILGGLGNITAALAGGVLVGIIEAYAAFFTSASLKSLFSFIFLIFALLIRPQGLFGKRK